MTNWSFTGEGSACRKALSARRVQVQHPHPRGEAPTSAGDATEELYFRGVIAGHCSFQVAKPAALEAESAGWKSTHLPSGPAGSS